MFTVGNYQVLRELDKRGWSTAYLGTDLRTRNSVLLQTIRVADHYPPDKADAFRGRLLGDVRAASSLSHPNIVAVYEAGRERDIDYVVTEYVNGRTLTRILGEGIPAIQESLRILAIVADALDHAHRHGMLHDHLGPDCIVIRDDGVVKLSAFGTARIMYVDVEALAPYPQRGQIPLPECPSPEFIRYEMPRTGRSDQFALAAVACHLLTGHKPYVADSLMSLLAKIVLEEPPPPQCIEPTLSPHIEPVLRKAMSKEPTGRFDTCTEFVGALRAACGS